MPLMTRGKSKSEFDNDFWIKKFIIHGF
jgi:hypothetical protein